MVPELPEVETIRRQLAPKLEGRTVETAWSFPSPKFDDAPAAVGRTIDAVRRRGKYLLIGLVDGAVHPTGSDPATSELVVHLGMTGRLGITPPGAIDDSGADDPHLRSSWTLDDGAILTFHDVRRFGRVAVVPAGDHSRLPTLSSLGPEPDDEAFDPDHLRGAVNRGRRAVKTVLLSQRVVAGVGNIYADEALWRAGIHPRARRLTRNGALKLRDAVRAVIAEGIEHGGTTLSDYRDAEGRAGTNQHRLDCYGRSGQPCRRCGSVLVRSVLDGRSTSWCPTCQSR